MMSAPEVIKRAITEVETLRIELGERALEQLVVIVPVEQSADRNAAR